MTMTLCSGCFAAITSNHVEYLREASYRYGKGGKVWVAIMDDALITLTKGHQSIDNYSRCKMLAALDFVCGVIVQEDPTPEQIIRRFHPFRWVKGGDYTVEQLCQLPEGQAVIQGGGTIHVTPKFSGPSTTEQLRHGQRKHYQRYPTLEGKAGIGRR
jgi:bifunctional ADP-heptose synthase (sugar kinase/adenylyltransferase)